MRSVTRASGGSPNHRETAGLSRHLGGDDDITGACGTVTCARRHPSSTGERKRGTHFSLTANLGHFFKRCPGRWSQNFRWPVLVKKYPGSTLTRAERELVATAVSAGNDCFYCMDTHGAF